MNPGCVVSLTYKCLGFVVPCQGLYIILTLPWIFFFFTLTNGNGEKLRIYLSDGPRCYGNRVQCECFAVRVHSGKKPLSCGLRSEDSCSPGIHASSGKAREPEGWLSGSESLLLLQKSQVQFLALTTNAKLPVASAPGDKAPSSGFWRHCIMCHTPPRHIHMHVILNF